MRKLLFIALFALGVAAQEMNPPPPSPPPGLRTDAPHRGTNFDPPPQPKSQKRLEYEARSRELEKPLFELPAVDWGTRETWVKLALLVGSVLLALRAFNDMTN